MTTFLLIRHGENDFTGKRLIGRLPGVHLNSRGEEEARLIGEFLKDQKLAAIYSSPLERAMETAEPLSRLCSVQVTPCEGLMEVNFGNWQGLTAPQMHRRKLYSLALTKPSLVEFPGGESYHAAQQRIIAALDQIRSSHAGEARIACFSHCDIIRLAVAGLIGLPLDEFQRLTVQTGSLSIVEIDQDKTWLRLLNYYPGQKI